METQIPIQNIYYLLCYAWNKLKEGEIIDVSSLESTKLVDLFAKVLLGGSLHLIRRGIDRGYIPCSEERSTIRGKIAFVPSVRRNLFHRGVAFCEFDELDYNVLHNRILKTTIQRLISVRNLDKGLREGLTDILRWLRNVEAIFITSALFRRVQLHRNNYYYGFLMNVCEIIHEHLLVDENTGQSRFRDFIREERAMPRLFEAFVRNFYHIEQNVFRVRPKKIKWKATFTDEKLQNYLPEMRTDVCLHSSGRTIIIDCKFYRKTLQKYYRKETFYSEHLYQMHAYLKNFESKPDEPRCEGILLYPAVNNRLDVQFDLQGHPMRIYAINLDQEWQSIKADLLNLIGD